MNDVVRRVIELWNEQGGWIPGASYRELAEALGVNPDDLIHYDAGRGRHYPEGWGPSDDHNIGIG